MVKERALFMASGSFTPRTNTATGKWQSGMAPWKNLDYLFIYFLGTKGKSYKMFDQLKTDLSLHFMNNKIE